MPAAEDLAGVDLNLLVILDALLTEKSLTRAGRRVNLSQSAMSHALRRLRTLFDDELLVRLGRDYELTARGQALVEPVHATIERIDDLIRRKPDFDPATARRTFSLGVSDYAAAIIVRRVLARVAAEAPHVSLRLIALTPNIGQLLRDGEIDLLILPKHMEAEIAPNLPNQRIMIDRLVVIAWSGNRAIGARLTLETMLTLPHVVFSRLGSPPSAYLERYIGAKQAGQIVTTATDHFILMPFLVEGTNALAVVQRKLAEWLQHHASLRILDFPYPAPDVLESMYWTPRHTADPAHLWLRSTIAEVAAEL